MIGNRISKNSLASRRGINLPELKFCKNYESKNTPPQIPHNTNYFCFDDITKYNWNNPPNKSITRRPDIEFFYKNHIKSLEKKNIETKEYIINKFFKNNDTQFVLTINEFPYWVQDATHWLLWFNPNNYENKNVNIKEITENLVKKNFPNKEVVMYENLNSNKTIKNIKHSHIFIKN